MLKTHNPRMGRNLLNTLRLFLIILCLTAGILVSIILLSAAINVTGYSSEASRSIAPICKTGETQVTRYAGQVTSMGCNCAASYVVEVGTGPLGPVEWEVCK
jgi:hypothetical protein